MTAALSFRPHHTHGAQIYFKYIKAMHAAFGSKPLPCYFGVEDLIDITMEGAQYCVCMNWGCL